MQNTLDAIRGKKLHLSNFKIRHKVGKGSYGTVFAARHRQSGAVCAIKTINKARLRTRGAEDLVKREVDIHSQLRYRGILELYTWFEDSYNYFLVMEYAPGGELLRALRQEGPFCERRAANYSAQIAAALQYLHSKDVIHRDLKLENVLLQANGKLMLADFGLSVSLPPGTQLYDSCGTLDYRAPEALGGQGYSREIDMWALGVMTYEFLTGRLPFYSEDDAVVRERIVKADITPLPTSVSYLAREYVHSLLELDPCWRLSCNEALLDPWILEHCQRC